MCWSVSMHSSETHMHSYIYTDASKRPLCNWLMEAQSGLECQIIKGVWRSSPVVIICVWFRKQRPGSEGQIRSSASCSVTIPSYCCYGTKICHSVIWTILSLEEHSRPCHCSQCICLRMWSTLQHSSTQCWSTFRANSFYLYYVSLTHPLLMVTPGKINFFQRLGAFLPQYTTLKNVNPAIIYLPSWNETKFLTHFVQG